MTESEHVDTYESRADDGMDYRLDYELTYARDYQEMDDWRDVAPAPERGVPAVPVRRVKDPHPAPSRPARSPAGHGHGPARRPVRRRARRH